MNKATIEMRTAPNESRPFAIIFVRPNNKRQPGFYELARVQGGGPLRLAEISAIAIIELLSRHGITPDVPRKLLG